MRGLPFPSTVVFDRETSYEYGTPVNNVGDIPIDPALVGPPIDPALMIEETNGATNQVQPKTQHAQQSLPPQNQYTQVQQYSEGPQGDPFAPQATLAYFPIEAEPPPPPPAKPVKRKRKARREEECGFCQGDDAKNKEGQPETMVTCTECGRSGHPSCMELTDVSHELLRAYPWKCLECKNCEICHEKGDDERILFCDFCDRGWHMYCLNPPLEEPPTGKWHCPSCPPLHLQMHYMPQPGYIPSPEHAHPLSDMPQPRASSVASSSRSVAQPQKGESKSKGKGKGKGKAKAVATDESGEDVDVEIEDTPKVARPRGRPKSIRKLTIPKEAQYADEEPPPSSPPRHPKRARVREPSPVTPPLPRVRLRLPSYKAKGKEREREEEEPKGFFDDILTPVERDTTKTSITNMDKQRFERSRVLAEQKFTPVPAPAPPILGRMSEIPEIPSTPGPSRPRPLRSSTTLHHFPAISTANPLGLSTSPAPSTPGPMSKTDPQTLRIRTIRFGLYDIKTWYDAPFPEEYASIPDGRLFICEFCLKYMKSWFAVERHRVKCKMRHPPGDEIYRDGTVSIFEVDGRKNKIYCQNLCLLSKMFLDHKSLFYDVEPFLFYVMTETDEIGARFVGYFSKEKRSPKDYNVSCIMTLPVRQRQGWGNLLIDFSYLLSKKEQRAGSPEKPLSSLGALGYRNYWTLSLMRHLETAPEKPRLEDISVATSMTIEDIYNTLSQQNMISARDPTPPPIKPIPGQSIKFPKGRKNGIARKNLQRTQTNDKEVEAPKGPFVAPTHYEIHWDPEAVDRYMRAWEAKGYFKLKPEKLSWSPYLLTWTRAEEKEKQEKEKESMAAAGTSGAAGSVEATDKAVKGTSNGNDNANSNGTESPSVTTFRSPLGIFDDEIVDEVLPVPPAKTKTKSKSKSKTSPTPEVVQPDADQIPEAEASPEPEKSSQKRLRSRSNQPSTMSTPKRVVPLVVEEPRTTRVGRKSSMKPHLVDGDEALATKLALEEQMQGRKLRSRPSGVELQRTASAPMATTTTPRTVPPRKRRRVDSPPEAEETPPPMVQSESPALVNGNHTDGKVLDLEASKLAAMLFEDEVVPTVMSVIAPSVQETRQSGTTEEPAKTEAVVTNDKDEPEAVKSEDLGTPLTSMTSRQSLPSEDTVVTAETVHEKDLAPPEIVMKLAGPTGPTVGTSEAEEGTNEPSASAGAETDADADADADADTDADADADADADTDADDADADGEYEEDAEGEPDGEGEMEMEEGTS